MSQVQSHNNSGLFRTNKYSIFRRKKKRYGRLFIRRSKIYHSIINNSSPLNQTTNNSLSQSYPYFNNLSINSRASTTQLKHKDIKQKLFNGAGDENIISSLSNDQKHIDFTELEHIFDNAIRNRLPVELYKQNPQTKNFIFKKHENLHTPQSILKSETLINNNPIDTRIELSNQSNIESTENIKCCFIHNIKQHKIISAIILITLSIIIGFLTVFIFIK